MRDYSDSAISIVGGFLVLCGLFFLLGFITGVVSRTDDTNIATEVAKKIDECQLSLRRTEHCKIIAVPKEKKE